MVFLNIFPQTQEAFITYKTISYNFIIMSGCLKQIFEGII